MRADEIFLLINEIDDALVVEAEGESAKSTSNRGFQFVGIVAAAACFATIIAGIFVIARIRMSAPPDAGNSAIAASVSSSSVTEVAESTSSTDSKEVISKIPTPETMFFKEPNPEDIVYDIEHNVNYVKNQLLISAALDAPNGEVKRLCAELGAEIVGYIALTNDYQIEFTEDKTLEELQAAADYIDSFSFVQSVTLNLVMVMNTDARVVIGVRY